MQPGLGSGVALLGSLVVDGRWSEAATILESMPEMRHAYLCREVSTATAMLGLHTGDANAAWSVIHSRLPSGPGRDPGDILHHEGLALQKIAVELSLASGDFPDAERWLQAHERWLDWGGAERPRLEGTLLRAKYLQRLGNIDGALESLTQVFTSSPALPLVTLAANRLAAEIWMVAGDPDAAQRSTDAALALAIRCVVPYERALSLLTRAALLHAMDDHAQATTTLDEASAIAEELCARPALDRTEELRALLGIPPQPLAPRSLLSARELEVLRLLGRQTTNREIAGQLFISPRTVQTHVEHICTKLGVAGRRQAALRGAELRLI